jgi:hypothetical protein
LADAGGSQGVGYEAQHYECVRRDDDGRPVQPGENAEQSAVRREHRDGYVTVDAEVGVFDPVHQRRIARHVDDHGRRTVEHPCEQ